MIKKILLLLLVSFSCFAIKVKLPAVEAAAILLVNEDVPKSKNYFYEIDFVIPFNRVKIFIYLKENGMENFIERENLANNLLVKLKKIRNKYKLYEVSGQVVYDKDQ